VRKVSTAAVRPARQTRHVQGRPGRQTIASSAEMRRLAHDIASSYESRVSMVGRTIESVYRVLDDFKSARGNLCRMLRDSLAASHSLRKTDFDVIIRDVLVVQQEKEKRLRELVRIYLDDQRDRVGLLRSALAEDAPFRAGEVNSMLADIQSGQRTMEEAIISVLDDFRREQEALNRSFCSFLAAGQGRAVKDFKETVRKFVRAAASAPPGRKAGG
jgi:hypothetical protein